MDYTNKIVCVIKHCYKHGRLYKVIKSYKGDEDMSHHGSPYYYNYIDAQDIETGEVKTFCDVYYCWRLASDYIKSLEDKLERIRIML